MAERLLRIGRGLALPREAVTETFAILAKRGVGKTYTASVLAEELIGAGLQTVVVDPIGVWWGLRSSADGKSPGLPVAIFGGDHADVPLEATGGKLVADLVVDERLSCVIDLSLLRKGQQVQFMVDFAETLYHRNRSALHLILDEADAFAPQKPLHGAERLLGAIEDLVRRGRARGIGVTLVTQRSAVLNKDVLTQAEVLIAMRTIAPQDRDAIDAWIKVHGTPEQRESLMLSLPSLPIGTAWFWSPGWLDAFQLVPVRARHTFDSSATPKAGQARAQPKTVADVDLGRIRTAMQATIQKADATDPRKLQARIRELEAELARKPVQAPPPEPVEVRVEVPVLDGEGDKLQRIAEVLAEAGKQAATVGAAILEAVARVQLDPAPTRHFAGPRPRASTLSIGQRGTTADVPTPLPALTPFTVDDMKLGKAERPMAFPNPPRAILSVLAQFPTRTLTQVAMLAGYSAGGLRSMGLIEGTRDQLAITPSGEALTEPTPLPQGAALLDMWLAHPRLGKAERLILAALHARYPQSATMEEVAEATGYEATGGGFGNALGRLRTLQLITGSKATGLRASEDLF